MLRAPSYFVSHGTALHTLDPLSAPLLALRAEGDRALRRGGLRAVVVLSAHWFAVGSRIGVGASTEPPTIHDHPSAHLYSFRYPARGDPALAAQVAQLLTHAGFEARLEDERGLDHGAWLALEMLLPGAPLPVVPVALPAVGSDAATYVRFGEALAPLRAAGVLLLCSGGATHNQDYFRHEFLGRRLSMGGDEASLASRRAALKEAELHVPSWSVDFDAWLTAALARTPAAARSAELRRYAMAPGGARSHPEPSHLLPALVFAGTAPVAAAQVAVDGFNGSPLLGRLDASVSTEDEDEAGAVKVAAGYQYGLSMSCYRLA